MNYLFEKEGVKRLQELGRKRVLFAFDFDGTLAPIVSDRNAAQMRPSTARLFEALCKQVPCALISGRSVNDVTPRLGNAPLRHIVGNHGVELAPNLAALEADMIRTHDALHTMLSQHRWADIEFKRHSLSIHFRRAINGDEARSTIARAIASLPTRMRIVEGKKVVNVVSPHAPHKGDALTTLAQQEHASSIFFVGDDVTDEDVFQLDDARLLTVRVGHSNRSAAQFFIHDQTEMDRLLTRLIEIAKYGEST